MSRNPRGERGGAAIGLVLASALLLAGCGTPRASGGRVVVVATTTVFADMVANVGGDLVSVTSLVPRNGDVHTFEARPSNMRTVAGAQLLVMNGLGLDDWLTRALGNAAQPNTPILRLAEDLPGVRPLPGEDGQSTNPHLWMDVAYAREYADRIAAALRSVDPANANRYDARNAAYQARLAQLDRWVHEQISTLPEASRRIVTFHDAFPYYARAYGLTVVGVAVPAPGQEPSARYTAQLVEAIRAAGVKAIFSEAQFPARLADQLAAETGARVVANLYDGSLGDSPVTSYEALIRWDTEQIVRALE